MNRISHALARLGNVKYRNEKARRVAGFLLLSLNEPNRNNQKDDCRLNRVIPRDPGGDRPDTKANHAKPKKNQKSAFVEQRL